MNVLRLRTEQRLSKTAFSLMSGISRPTLNEIESGVSNVRLSYVQSLADALCVDPIQLLFATDDFAAGTDGEADDAIPSTT